MDGRSARNRALAAGVASTALLVSGTAISTTPAQSAPLAPNCAERATSPVEPGQEVETLTVTRGTVPETFSGTVIDVLENGIAPQVPMIIADFGNQTGNANNDTAIDEAGGIWQGMSGSPVYLDGKLIGAVAYGLSWGPSTVAGITPVAYMDEYLPPAETEVTPAAARSIAAATDVTAGQASTGMKRLRVPLTVSGIDQARLRDLRSSERGDYLHRAASAGTLAGTAAGAAAASDIVDGGNLGAAISYGTITTGGVGTVTDVCGTAIIGFGHPMMFSGATSMGLMPADALYVQKESLGAPFKVANLADAPAGTITQDRLAGLTGTLSTLPPETPISSHVKYGTRERDGESSSLSQDWNADVTVTQLLALHDVTIDAIQPGSETSSVRITADAGDGPVVINSSDRFVSDWDIAIESLWSTADLVYALSRIDGVEVTSIATEGEVFDGTDVLRVGQLQQRRGGEWSTVSRRQPARVTEGGVLHVRVALEDADGSHWLTQELRVPRKTGREGRLEVTGGAWTWNDDLWEAQSLEDVQDAVAGDVRNDQVETRLSFWSRRSDTSRRVVSDEQELVVEGHRSIPVVVRR